MNMSSNIEQELTQLLAAQLIKIEGERRLIPYEWIRAMLIGNQRHGRILDGCWPGKVVIGLTGNIAVGKSTVLHELEGLGAGVIDADKLVHQLRQPGQPGHAAIIDLLGAQFLRADGKIDSVALASRAFADTALLRELEQIFRPLVVEAIDLWARSVESQVLVIEAIKLLEGNLKDTVDRIWVVDAPRELQIARLVEQRGLSLEEALRRIDAQNPQQEKLAQADVVIHNGQDFAQTYWQVMYGWAETLEILAERATPATELLERFVIRSLELAGAALPLPAALERLAVIARENCD